MPARSASSCAAPVSGSTPSCAPRPFGRVRPSSELDLTLAHDQIEITDVFYNAGSDSLIEAVRALPDDTVTALLVGHAPGLPSVAYELADPSTSDRSAVAAIEHRFPAATLARLEWEGIWSDPDAARLVGARLPTQTSS